MGARVQFGLGAGGGSMHAPAQLSWNLPQSTPQHLDYTCVGRLARRMPSIARTSNTHTHNSHSHMYVPTLYPSTSTPPRLYKVHEEDGKPFELEMTWICEESGWKHARVCGKDVWGGWRDGGREGAEIHCGT